jgi:hypothetical protein
MKIISTIILTLILFSTLSAQWTFLPSLHKTRAGFDHAYNKENGGMEIITNIPSEQLSCKQCHSVTGFYADGTPINPVTYTPICLDCHNFQNGVTVSEDACLNCHQRQRRERELYPGMDVHQDEGFTCMSCHSEEELHGDDGIEYSSLKEAGAVKVKCTDCHTQLNNNGSHNRHLGKVDCSACHAVSVYSCGGCHFETYTSSGKGRFNNEFKDYRLLVKKDGLVKLGALATHSYNGKTNYIISSTHSHIIKRNATTCSDCHRGMGQINVAIKEYNDTGSITLTKWNADSKKIEILNAVIPIPGDWQQSLKIDHVTYAGDSTVFPTDPALWEYLKSETDNAHLYYAEPLDSSTLANLGFTRFPTGIEDEIISPTEFILYQNYPNPFNPNTTISWQSPVSTWQTIKLFNSLGQEVETIVNEYLEAGVHSKLYIVHSTLPSGIYYYQLKAGDYTAVKKMLLLK